MDYRRRRLEEDGGGGKAKRKVGEKAIKNELDIRTTAFDHARKLELVARVPLIEKPVVDNERKKEIAVADYFSKILPRIADQDARDCVEWMLLTARRPQGIGQLR